MPGRDLGPWQYTDNNARVYIRRADKALTSQEATPGIPNVGGSSGVGASAANYEPFPSNYRPRHVVMSGPGTGKRQIVVYSTDAPLWSATPPPMTVRDVDGTSHTITVEGRVDERLGRRIGRNQ
jgi:hypothetical protein